MTINYSPISARAIGFLKSPLNDIEVFVEDASRSAVWTALVKKSLPTGVRLASVTPLGSRDDVIAACRADQVGSRPRIYIIDADWDFLLRRGMPKLSYLYRVPAMNLEGLIFSSSGLGALIEDLNPLIDGVSEEKQLRTEIELRFGRNLRKIFVLYAVHFLAGGELLTNKHHVSRLAVPRSKPWTLCKQLCFNRSVDVGRELKRIGWNDAKYVKRLRLFAAQLSIEKVMSGKTYLLPILQNILLHKYNIRFSTDDLMLLIISKGTCPAPRLRVRLRALF